MKSITFIIFAIFLFLRTEAQVFEEWAQRYNGPDSLNDAANAIDADGNVYVAGYTYNNTTLSDFITLKYSSSGELLWAMQYNGGANGNDQAIAITTDGSGNAYVLGNSDGVGSGQDLVTIKYDANGNELWTARFDYNNSFQMGSAIAIDATGNVFIIGSSDNDYVTVKYNSNGIQQWVNFYDGPANSLDRANALAVDQSGNAYVTGFSTGIGTKWDFATIKYNNSGTELWVARHNNGVDSNDVAHDIALDKNGNVYVTGTNFTLFELGHDYATVKYNSSGVEQWVSHYNGPGNGSDIATSVAVDNSANVYVTGFSIGAAGSFDYATVKYNTNGILKWAQRYDGPANGIDIAFALALDKNSNVYVTGASIGSGSGIDYTTIKYASAGQFEWVQRYNGTANGADRANAIAVDTIGNVFVTGVSTGTGTGLDIVTVKYVQSDISITIATINKFENELKSYLDIIARSIVNFINDTAFVNMVYDELKESNLTRVSLPKLISRAELNGYDLIQKLKESLLSFGNGTEDEANKLSYVVNSFGIGNGIKFTPEIIFPAALDTITYDIIGSSWDLKTPCFIATSLFYMKGKNIPTYHSHNNTYLKLAMSKEEVFVHPVWHINLNPNFSVGASDNNIVNLNKNGKLAGIRKKLVDLFAVGSSCDCVEYHVDDPNGPIIFLCEGSGTYECGSSDDGCDSQCQIAEVPIKTKIRNCNQ